MVRGFAMESQDKRMCKSECGFSGVTVDEDYFGDILNMFDFPMETLEGDGLAEDWASKLGPIPSEVFRADLPFQYPVINNINPQLNHEEEAKKLYPSQGSPNSVLESRSSSLNNKGVSIPVRTRSKRLRPTTNPWLHSHLIMIPSKDKKRKQNIMETKKLIEKSNVVGTKKCSHCEITKTPQWREGPMGPKTLCNACGVRYRSGRLYPEYRPAASPTFVPALHSNSHRKVIEMRQKAI